MPVLIVLATIALVVLKVTGVLAISWFVALLPLVIAGGLFVVTLFVVSLVGLVAVLAK